MFYIPQNKHNLSFWTQRVDFEDDFPFQKGDFVQVPDIILQRSISKCGGSTLKMIHYKLMEHDP